MTINRKHLTSTEAIDKIIGEALVNKRFRAILLSNPGKLGGSFNLSPEERQLLSNLRVGSLEELASQLYDEIRKCEQDHVSK